MVPVDNEISDEAIKNLLDAIKAHSNYDFTNYSVKSLKRRIAKIMNDSKLTIEQLEREIITNEQFMEKVVIDITVNTTDLFRDPSIWVNLKEEILPKFQHYKKINIWHAGCSTGQEVYSMMILLSEMDLLSKAEIYASDINSNVLKIAQIGRYRYRFNHAYVDHFDTVFNPGYENTDEKPVPVSKYFNVDIVSDSIQMKPFLTEKPIYKKIDLVKDENLFFVKFDLIICRNVIIYFNYDLQNKVFDLFHKNLFNDGCLVLGIHESILGPYAGYFEKKDQVYFKKNI